MFQLYTFPSEDFLRKTKQQTPAYMHPNTLPSAVVFEEYLTDTQCDAILLAAEKEDPYKFGSCNAITRECARPLDWAMDPIVNCAMNVNRLYWEYDVDDEAGAWLQTYEKGGSYHDHVDGAPGQMRKLTAVALLSDPNAYDGGNLRLHLGPLRSNVPRARGTIVVFQPWLIHDVTEVTRGIRQTLNLGLWGPNFV